MGLTDPLRAGTYALSRYQLSSPVLCVVFIRPSWLDCSRLSSSLSFSAFVFHYWLSIFDGGVKRVCETLMADADVLSPLVARLEVRDRVVSRVHCRPLSRRRVLW